MKSFACLLLLAAFPLARGEETVLKTCLPQITDAAVHRAALVIAGTPLAAKEESPDPAASMVTIMPAEATSRPMRRLFIFIGDGYGTVFMSTNLRTGCNKLGTGVVVVEEAGLADRSDAWRLSLLAQVVEHAAAYWPTPRQRIILVGYGSGARLAARLVGGRALPIGGFMVLRGLGEAPTAPAPWLANLPMAVLAPPGNSTPAWKLLDAWKPLGLRIGSFEGSIADGRATNDDIMPKRFAEVLTWFDGQDDLRSADLLATSRQAQAKDPVMAWELASQAAGLAWSNTAKSSAAARLEELREPVAAALGKLAARKDGAARAAMMAPHTALDEMIAEATTSTSKAIAALPANDPRARLGRLAKLRQASVPGPARVAIDAAIETAVAERIAAVGKLASVKARAKEWNELLGLAPGSPGLFAIMATISSERFQAANSAQP